MCANQPRIVSPSSLFLLQKIDIDATTGVTSYAGGLKGLLPFSRRREGVKEEQREEGKERKKSTPTPLH